MVARETQLQNAYETTLISALSASSSDQTVSVAASPASIGDFSSGTSGFYLVIDPDSDSTREYIYVSAKTGVNFTATRNIDTYGGGLNAHSIGAKVRFVTMAEMFNDVHSRVNTIINEAGTAVNTTLFLDEDNMSSNSATKGVTQQSVKAYVDSQSNDGSLDISADSGSNIAIALDTEVLDLEGGTGITTTTGTNKVTLAIDSTVVTETSTDTLTNKSINLANNTLTTTFALLNTAVSDATLVDLDDSQTLTNKALNLANNTLTTTFAQLNTAVSDATLVDLDDVQTLTNKVLNLESNTAIVEFAVTVANPGSGNRYYLDGELSANVQLIPGVTYRFDQSDNSNSGHPLRLSITKDGTHNSGSAYTTGVTTPGSAGSAGGYTQIVVNAATADNLYYYCSSHSGMGGDAVISINATGLQSGNGITISSNSAAINSTIITGQTNEGTADNNDVILIYDDSASGLKKQTRSAFLSGTGVGNMNSFNISDGSTSQTISDANTITFSGTSNEVEVAVSATDTVTIGLPSSITASLTGNASTATALQTARTIGGVSFNGTANINLPGVNAAGNQNTSGTAAGLSATLTVASGGTGATSFADKSVIITQDTGTDTLAAVAMDANGELLIGGTSGPAVGTLTAGSGITVTNADGAITIAATTGGDITAVNTASNSGLAGGATSGAVSLTVDPSNLTDGTSITVDTDNDFLILEDVTNNTVYKVNPSQIASGSANALIVGDSDFTLTDGIANGIHYELDNTDMADWNQAGVVLSTAGGIFQHNQVQAATYTVPANTGSVMAGPITITGTVTNNGTLVVI